ncbi:penicillin-binding protein 2 [Candidatus Saganbacteria bacterium]|uniref:Penicillin-binding protein 2 n=1 Tax=Candidatus Saganbacteria bacterium TaxID=2575572 RepID=A0A9D6ULW5_UNCSA|nr:penicillin-binding protein 2 [Candidatus Saganbacteria bacterium]
MKTNRILILVFGVVFTVLFLRLFQLQVIEGPRYRKLAVENAARTVPALAPRGVVYDRQGRVIVENRPAFSVQIMPHLSAGPAGSREAVLSRLSGLLGEPVEFKVSASQPVVIKENVRPETAIRIEEQNRELPGVAVSIYPSRFYPHGQLASHLLGYVGEIESEELRRLKNKGYRLGDIIGKDGLEKLYDKEIRGVDGGKVIEVNVYGTPTRLLKSLEPVPGADVKLTIDLDLQLAAEKALGARRGAVAILDPETGEMLALASNPDYDPNVFINPLARSGWETLTRGQNPFMNRALAIYPAGSIFKVVTLTAALEEGLTRPGEIINCAGYYQLGGRIAKCWKESGHGRITVAEGLVQSCDVVFYELGRRLGPERLAKYANAYGLGEKTRIDLPQEKKGLVPTSDWKSVHLKETWYEGDSINYGIGQGFLQVTPLQMAVVYGTVASGKRMRPFVVSEIKKRNGEVLYQAQPEAVASAPASPAALQVIRKALSEVVARGTGIAAKIPDFPAAGKTGTAQNPGLPHAWFLCYAPTEEPKFVIASFVEHGEHGDRSAAYVARDILLTLKDKFGKIKP